LPARAAPAKIRIAIRRVEIKSIEDHVEQRRENPASASDIEQVYARLRRIAARLMKNERPGHTLWPTDVVNETMARLLERGNLGGGGDDVPLPELIGRAAHVMQQVLVDHARRRGAAKRGGGGGETRRVSLEQIDDFEAAIESPAFDWPELERALQEMSAHDPRRHKVVMLRFFGGMNNRQIARELGIEERTVGRDWAAARLWLKKRLQSTEE
jgi:RNA polymerase sigma factor (TIGR02999 family)